MLCSLIIIEKFWLRSGEELFSFISLIVGNAESINSLNMILFMRK